MLGEMVPVLPRRRLEFESMHEWRREQIPPKYVRHNVADASRFALYAHTISSCQKRKVHVNHRLVIVGCSCTALAFLEHMLYGCSSRGLMFTHLTLISPNGFADSEFDDITDMAKMFHDDAVYTADFVRRMAFRTWVNSVHGLVTKINRYKGVLRTRIAIGDIFYNIFFV